jgi:hypothetical protein
VNGLYAIAGNHTYHHAGVHQVTVTTTAAGTSPASVSFYVRTN